MPSVKVRQLGVNRELYRIATHQRLLHGFPLSAPLDPFNLAEKLGLDVRFVDVPGIDGIYLKEQQTIVVSSCRPSTRQIFTCAHEISHHILGHGSRLDERLSGGVSMRVTYEERQANVLASALLISDRALSRAIRLACDDERNPAFEELYSIACYFSVSLAALLARMGISKTPNMPSINKIREGIAKRPISGPLIVVKDWWNAPITVCIGDHLQLPPVMGISPKLLTVVSSSERLYCAAMRGSGEITFRASRSHVLSLRVMPSEYVGLAQYRFLEE